ncbi:unnamed protein product [Ectocarpus sp. 6 AP-2014]
MARGLGVRRLMAKFLLLHCMHGDAARPSPASEEAEEETGDGQEGEGESQDRSQGEGGERQDGGASNDLGNNNNKEHVQGREKEQQEQAEKGKHPSPSSRAGKGVDRQKNAPLNARSRSSSEAGVSKVGGGASSEPSGVRPLVLCLNAKGEEELFLDALMADGVPPNRLPEVVDAECTPAQRGVLYASGGVYIVTSRVLIVDLLTKTVKPEQISGMLVHNAHRVVETSSEAFILRIYREGNGSGFVKGFTDEPESLLAGFGKLEKILRNLGVTKVFLWPRFHSLVAESLERRPPQVEELVQGLTAPTKEVQQAIVVLMDHTLRELRGAAPSLDSAGLTVESCIFNSFDRSAQRQLEPEWHRVGFKTKQLLQDLKTLRSLLDYLFRYDAITFYQLLLGEKSKAAAVRDPPLWIGTSAADRLFVTAKARVYKIVPRNGAGGAAHGPRNSGVAAKKNATAAAAAAAAAYEVKLVLEENAKWRLAADVMKEIRDLHAARQRQHVVSKSPVPAESSAAAEPAGGARVLVLVKDEQTCTQLRQHSALGAPAMMTRRFLQFVRESEERTGRVAAARGGGGWKGGRRWNSKGGESAGRWGAKPKRGGMSGVGVGASPAFRHSSSSATAGGRGGGEGATKGTKLSLERSLLKELRERLESEQAVADVLEQQQQQQRRARRVATAAAASTGTVAKRGGGSVDLTGDDDDDGEDRDASPLRGDDSGHAGENRRRKVGTGKKRSREGDGGQSGDAPSVPEKRGGEGGGRKEDDVGGGRGGRGSSSSSEARKASAGRGGVSRGRGSRGGSGRGGRSARRGGNASGASSAARTGGGEAGGCASGGGGGGGEDLVFEPLPSLHAVVFSYAQARESLNILQDLEPDFVVLYDPDAAFVRTLEAYQAGRPLDRPPLVVYFMLYEQSVEEQRYLTSLDRETKAFKSLIEEKARMTVPVRTTTSFLPAERTAREGKVTRLSTPLAEAGKGSSSGSSSRKGGRRQAQASLRVVVDLREFRSVLPNLLHQQGFELVPLVIAVGDYVLTPQICVERKSLSDLFQSMSSGRLYNQVEAMLKHYKVPVLLIEFNPDKAFCLLGSGDLASEIKLTSITSQLTLLTLHFPQLRILWSKSEHATADMFKELMKNNAAVDVAKAQAAGGGGEDDQGTGDDASAKELLMRLPGVSVYNFRNVLREVDTIAELSQLSEEQLRPLLGDANAAKLYKFFRQPAPV